MEEEKKRRVDAESRLATLTQEKAAWEASMAQKGEEMAAASSVASAASTSSAVRPNLGRESRIAL